MTGNGAEEPGQQRIGAVLLCVLLSVLLHALVVWLLLQMPQQEMFARQPLPQKEYTMRYLQVHRGEARKQQELQAEAPEEKPQQERERSFAKTNPDAPEHRALDAEHVGARNTTAASAPDATDLRDDRQAPAMDGRQMEEDRIEILEQDRQDGDIDSEQRAARRPMPPAQAPAPPRPLTAVVPPTPLPVVGKADGTPEAKTATGEQQEARPGESSASVHEQVALPNGQLRITKDHEKPTPDQQEVSQVRQGAEQGRDEGKTSPMEPAPQPRAVPQPEQPSQPARPERRQVYDPSLPAHMQPGFRTYERRSRSTGTFVVGRTPSLNVEATPRGRYEALLYRLIARSWYMACDEHRGDIIPGSLTISVCLNKQGRIDNLQLYGRRGASVLQQSFTFTAIRRAALPPMPAAVQKEVDSDLIEMLITFHFD